MTAGSVPGTGSSSVTTPGNLAASGNVPGTAQRFFRIGGQLGRYGLDLIEVRPHNRE
jgi:hypothetical protein